MNPWADLISRNSNPMMTPMDSTDTTQPNFDPSAEEPARDLASVGQLPKKAKPALPSNNQENVNSSRNVIQDYISGQKTHQNYLQQLADQYGGELDKQKGQINLQPLKELYDMWTGSKTAQNYKAPLTPAQILQEKAKMEEGVDKSGAPIASELLKQQGQEMSGQNQYYRTMASLAKQAAGTIQTPIVDPATGAAINLTKPQQDLAKQYHQDLFLDSRGVNAGAKVAQNKLQAATQFENLAAALPQGKVTPQDMADLVQSQGMTINGTNILTDHRFASLYPGSAPLTGAGLVQWFKGSPNGVAQTEWLNRMNNEVQAEKQGASNMLDAWGEAQRKAYSQRGLPNAFVDNGLENAKNFYKTAYKPVSGIGGFNPTGIGTKNAGPGPKPMEGAELVTKPGKGKVWAIPLGNGKYKEVPSVR